MMFLGKPLESGSARLGHIPMQFHLLRKRGLLAHTSAAFLKNCCTEKLFICLRLVTFTLKGENKRNCILHFVKIYDILVTSNKQSDFR